MFIIQIVIRGLQTAIKDTLFLNQPNEECQEPHTRFYIRLIHLRLKLYKNIQVYDYISFNRFQT